MDWMLNEINGYSFYSAKGYRILISLVDNRDYDFVIVKDNEYKRVNVKTAGAKSRKKNYIGYSISNGGSSNKPKQQREVDIYLVWMPDHKIFIELDGSFLDGRKSRVIPAEIISNLIMPK